MLKINNLKLPVMHTGDDLFKKVSGVLRAEKKDIIDIEILRRSLEARKAERLSFVYSAAVNVRNEERILKRLGKNAEKSGVSKYIPVNYSFPFKNTTGKEKRPVIIGSGPAGLFCAYELSKAGFCPLVLERGKKAEERMRDVEAFWKTGKLDASSNVQFGEGGAGTFSDGKLNTSVNDRKGRKKEVLSVFVSAGAKESILYDAKPHIGTDELLKIIPNIREKIISCGGEFRFSEKAEEIVTENSKVKGIITEKGEFIPAETIVLAIGHSARDTFASLYKTGVAMEAKAFAVGVRVSHPQELINKRQWGEDYPESLGSASYTLAGRLKDGRGVYSFCMCPGGYVVNASSEEGRLAVNGMSYSGRSSRAANSAIVVTVEPKDFSAFGDPEKDPLIGVSFQEELERKAFEAGGGKIPVQYFKDFKENRISEAETEENLPTAKGETAFADVRGVFPAFLSADLIEGITYFDSQIHGFADDSALLYAVESRTSSPVRIPRDETLQSSIRGLFPAGEGAGYAGGIVSAAMDGIKAAEAVAAVLSGTCL